MYKHLVDKYPEIYKNITPEGIISIHRHIWSYAEINNTKYGAPFTKTLIENNGCIACALVGVWQVCDDCQECPINWGVGPDNEQLDCENNLYSDWVYADDDVEEGSPEETSAEIAAKIKNISWNLPQLKRLLNLEGE